MTTTHDFEKLDDDELRERVLDALETIERRTKGPAGMTTKASPPSGSVGEAVTDLKALFGGDEIESDDVGKDVKGWM